MTEDCGQKTAIRDCRAAVFTCTACERAGATLGAILDQGCDRIGHDCPVKSRLCADRITLSQVRLTGGRFP